ncbi:thiol reductant ABC exporter subunit CydD [Microbacterium sp. YY-03]|uniref:thiol reductant ABC exporter subunit CydD n=1 Tax=Microbacterium sp. YY-03 TaxID=3421636 RepID=UPI003D17EABF
MLRHARSARGFFGAQAVISLLSTAAIVAFAWLITAGIVGAVDGTGTMGALLGVLTLVVVVRAAMVWATERISARAAARVGSQLRTALITAISARGSAWLDSQNSAQLTLTATRGLGALDAYFGRFLPQLVATIVTTPILVAIMWFQDLPTGITLIITLPLIPLFMILIGLATRAVQEKQWSTLQKLAVRFADTVQGLATLRIFGRAERAATNVETSSDEYGRATMKVLRVTFLSGFALELLSSLAVALIAVSVGLRLLSGDLDLSVGLFVLLLAPDAFLPLRQVGAQFHAATEGVQATRDVLDLLDEAAVAAPRTAAKRGGDLVLDDVRVTRGEHELAPVSFVADRGTITALGGASGSGKSSVFAALRGAAPFTGSCTFGGVSTAELDPSTWLAWAGQAPVLFAGTVASNVTLGSDADDAVVAWALRTAGASEISADAVIAADGSGLSGGQAQRVAVARALYRWRIGPADVIALDEPSSALDGDAEAALWAGLRQIADEGATVLLISHRPSAFALADAVVMMTEVHA